MLRVIVILAIAFCGMASPQTGIPVYTYTVVHTYPHDGTAFTEGLFYQDGFLYEGIGMPGKSSIRKVRLETGQIVQRHKIPQQYFGEGIVAWKNRLFELSYTTHVGFIYDLKTFALQGTFHYPGEGWSMTEDGQRIIMDDGTPTIRLWDPETLRETGRITITANSKPVEYLNELEWVKGKLYANIWHTDRIAIVDLTTGHVTAWIDLTGLLPRSDVLREPEGGEQVLNGIAYDAEHDRLFVTGKYWPKLFELRLQRKQ